VNLLPCADDCAVFAAGPSWRAPRRAGLSGQAA